MLKEILDTRVMVKRSMKLYKDDATMQRVLHSRYRVYTLAIRS